MIGNKVLLTNGNYGRIIDIFSPSSVILYYKGKEGETTALIDLDEIRKGPVFLNLFDDTITGCVWSYPQIQRDKKGRIIR